jgi:hypothetical protein
MVDAMKVSTKTSNDRARDRQRATGGEIVDSRRRHSSVGCNLNQDQV